MTRLVLYLLFLLAGLVLVNVLLLREVRRERPSRRASTRQGSRERSPE
jgi:hypothetical protein